MDIHDYKFLIFINSVMITDSVSLCYNETYNGYTWIMPLTDGNTRSPLNLTSSNASLWCSSINSTLPKLTDEGDQKNIVQFIRSAVRINKLDSIQNIFVNNIAHTVSDWTWVNGQTTQGFTVVQVSKDVRPDRYFGYLQTDDYRICQGQHTEQRRYICEKSEHSSDSFRCKKKIEKICYWKKDDALTWYKARYSCMNEGGDLASFDTLNEKDLNDSLKDLGLIATQGYWVGIYKSDWRWNEKGIDSEIKYSNWKDKHPSNYNAKCLCLDKQPNDYEWIECDCDQEYPFICKSNDTSARCPQPKDQEPSTSVISQTTAPSLLVDELPNASVVSETTERIQPIDQMSTTSLISETVRLALVLSSCALIVVIIILTVAAFIIQKQKNRPVSSSRYETAVAETSGLPLYAEIQELRGNISSTNCPSSSAAYANVQFVKSELLYEHTLYAELDL